MTNRRVLGEVVWRLARAAGDWWRHQAGVVRGPGSWLVFQGDPGWWGEWSGPALFLHPTVTPGQTYIAACLPLRISPSLLLRPPSLRTASPSTFPHSTIPVLPALGP
jgi:hypothetical protein